MMNVGKPGSVRVLPSPGTSIYNAALALLAGMGGSAEAKARMEEIRDARADLDAVHAEAVAETAKANAAIDAAYREQKLLGEARDRNGEQGRRLQGQLNTLADERAALDAQRQRDTDALRQAVGALDEARAELAAKSQALDGRDAETKALNDAAKSLRDAARVALDEATGVKAELERRLARIAHAAEGK